MTFGVVFGWYGLESCQNNGSCLLIPQFLEGSTAPMNLNCNGYQDGAGSCWGHTIVAAGPGKNRTNGFTFSASLESQYFTLGY